MNKGHAAASFVLILVVIASALVVPATRIASAGYNNCEVSPFLCYNCAGTPWRRYCRPLPYDLEGYCQCVDDFGCDTFGNWCVAIIIV